MTCIIALKKNEKVYLGSDVLVSQIGDSQKSELTKIISKEKFLIGVAGARGFYNLLDWVLPIIDLKNKSVDDFSQEVCNIAALFNSNIAVIICAKNKIIEIRKNNNGIYGTFVSNKLKDFEFCTIGVGADVVFGSLHTSKSNDPRELIIEAIGAVATGYSNSVGGNIQIEEI